MIGTSLHQYQITASIGAGGMGEVFRARDTRLNRDVAVKVLPRDFAADANRVRRFEQEAKTLAALNHPNVLTIHDAGIHDGAPYLVSELLEGKTLREEMNDGALPARKATEYAMQIAHGLAAAHAKGVIHRDLKPENVFVTKDGRVKILDFGLAKLLVGTRSMASPSVSSGNAVGEVGDAVERVLTSADTDAPTAMQAQTEPGAVMGTPGYMSPEQVNGQEADHRSDIFSFGDILYEMLSGQRAFRKESSIETMHAILRDEPPELSESNPNLSPALDRMVRRCLEKNREQRFQSASDLAFALESLTGSTTTILGKVDTKASARGLLPKLGLAALGLILLGVAAGSWLMQRAPETSAATYKQFTSRRGTVFHARFAPEGKSVFYSARWGREPLTIFTTQEARRTDSSMVLTNADLLAVSGSGDLAVLLDSRLEDGGYASRGMLARMKPGEAPRPLLENVTEADWFPDGTNLLVVHVVGGMWRLEEFPSHRILHETAGYITSPRVSPGGDRIAFLAHQLRFDNRGWAVILDRAGKTNAVSSEWTWVEGLTWSPTGKEVWFSATKTSDRMDLHALSVSGAERQVASLPVSFIAQDIAADGRVLAQRLSQSSDLIHGLTVQAQERSVSWLNAGRLADFSADGKSYLLSFAGEGSGADYLTYLCKTDGSPALQLGEGSPRSLSPDGRWVLVLRFSPSRLVMLSTGVGQPKTIELLGVEPSSGCLLPDGKRVLFAGHEPGQLQRFFVQDIDGGKPQPVTPEGVDGPFGIAPSGEKFFGTDTNQVAMLCFANGSTPKPIPGVGAQDAILGWCADNQSVFVGRRGEWPFRIYKLEVVTGQKSREPVITISPTDLAGVGDTLEVFVTPDGRSYLYQIKRNLSDLFVAEGLK